MFKWKFVGRTGKVVRNFFGKCVYGMFFGMNHPVDGSATAIDESRTG
jgi:hypothetical protein